MDPSWTHGFESQLSIFLLCFDLGIEIRRCWIDILHLLIVTSEMGCCLKWSKINKKWLGRTKLKKTQFLLCLYVCYLRRKLSRYLREKATKQSLDINGIVWWGFRVPTSLSLVEVEEVISNKMHLLDHTKWTKGKKNFCWIWQTDYCFNKKSFKL